MIETLTAAAKFKALLAALSLLILGGGLYELSGDHGINTAAESKDPFVTDIQNRAELVNNAVNETVIQQGKQTPLVYKQTCENSLSFIRSERLDTNTNYNTLDNNQKELIQEYRVFLKEAANVVTTCYIGKTPDLSAMQEAKSRLF